MRGHKGTHRRQVGLGANFAALWFGQAISQIGDYVAYFAIPAFVAFFVTENPSAFGMIYAAENFPILLAGLFVGVLLDRVRIRPVLIASDLIRAVLFIWLGRLASTGGASLTLLLIISFLLGTFLATFASGLFSFLPSVVSDANLPKANARIATTQQIAFVIGPPIGGLLAAAFGFSTAFYLNSLTFLISAVSLSLVSVTRVRERQEPAGVLAEAKAGLSFVWNEARLRWITIAGATANFVVAFIESILVLIGLQIFGITSEQELSTLWIASGVGGMIGALLAARITAMLGLGRALVIGLAGFGTGFATLTWMPNRAGVLASLFLTFFSLSLVNIPIATMRQLYTPDHLLGRVTSASRAIAWGTLPIGALFNTWLAGKTSILFVARFEPLLIIAMALYLIRTPVWTAQAERESVPS